MDFVDKYNMAVGAVVAVFTMFFGGYWYLFAGYLLLNVLDWITGWYRSRRNHEESSKVGLKGIIKKTGYWVIIVVAFAFSDMMIKFGNDVIGIRFDFLMLFGWFTLATLIINEARSIIENLVECGYNVPDFLVRGLAVTEKLVKAKTNAEVQKEEAENDDKPEGN